MSQPNTQPKVGRINIPDRRLKRICFVAVWLLINATLAVQAESPRPKPPGKPLATATPADNVFALSYQLPAEVKRVLVLPLTGEGSATERERGCEMLGPVLLGELVKSGKFEAVPISPEALRSQTGRASWTGAEILPADFFDSLQRVSGCDAVLFCELTLYRAYAPQAVGWRMKLVDVRTHQILWAVDKTFDAAQPNVAKEAHQSLPVKVKNLFDWSESKETWLMDHSPRQFGQYTAARVVATLPQPQEKVKVSPTVADVTSEGQSDKKALHQ